MVRALALALVLPFTKRHQHLILFLLARFLMVKSKPPNAFTCAAPLRAVRAGLLDPTL